MASNRLELILSAKTKDANDALKQFDRQVDDTMGAVTSKAQEAGLALGGLAIAGAAMTKSFIDKAVEMQKFQGTLTAVMKDADGAKVALQKMVDFAASTPFDLPGVVAAGVKLKSLNQDVDKFLPLAGDLAAVFGRDIKDAADALGKALSGSQDGVGILADAFGIARAELIKFGAAAKSDGSIDVTQIDKLRDALEKVIKTKYGGAMDAQAKTAAGAFANLSDAVGQLKAAMGTELADDFAKVAKALTKVAESATALPAPTKAMIAQTVVLGTGLAVLGAAALGAAAAFGPLILAWQAHSVAAASAAAATATLAAANAATTATAATAAMALAATEAAAIGLAGGTATAATGMGTLATASAAATISLGAVLGVVGVVAVAAAGFVHWYGKAADASEELRKKSQAAASAFHAQRDAVLLAADALRQYGGDVEKAGDALADMMKQAGKTEVDANEAIKGLLDQLKQAQETGDSALEKRLQDRIRAFTRAREALAGTQAEKDAKEAKAAADAKAGIEARTQAVEDYKKKASAAYWATAKEELAALDSVMVRFPVMSKEYQEFGLARVKLAREAAKEEQEADEKTRQEKLASALHEVDVLKAYGDKRLSDQLALLQQILARENVNAEERKRLELEVISTQEKLADQAERAAQQRRQEREKKDKDALKAKQDLAKLEGDVLQAQVKASDVTIKGLEEQLKQGKDVGAQLQAEIAARGDLTQKIIEQQAAAEKIGRTAAEQAQIEKKAQAEIKAAKGGTEQEAAKASKDAAESRKKSALETLKLERELLDAKAASDKNVTKQDLVNVAKQRLAIAKQQLQIEAEIAGANASEEEKKRISTQLELDVWKTRKASVTELATATAELEKQNEELKKMREPTFKGVQSLEDMVKDLNDRWSGADRKPEPQAESGLTNAQVQQSANTMAIPNFKIEFVVPQGAPQDGWTFRSQQT